MRIKIFLKKLISLCVAVFISATCVGCFDLGDFKNEAEYYDSFGDVGLVYQDPDTDEKSVEEDEYSIQDYFYNKNTGKSFSYGDPEDEEPDEGKDIPQLPYAYMSIPVERDLKMESLGLYFNTTQTCTFEVVLYLVDDLPDFSNIWLLGEPEYQQKEDDKGEMVNQKIEYSDPDDSKIVARASVQAKAGEWVSILVKDWNSGKRLEIKESQYLLLRFANNCGISTQKDSLVSFRTTNLLLRAIF